MPLWELTGPLQFYDRSEGVVVCYHADSGDTHLISADAQQLLLQLRDGPADAAVLAADALLAELAAAGLVYCQ
ncbi:hypothetical protein [Parahaliea mediterranea]|uniref:hypothetical protein n=1 Tax=Parahaliea mediterranea TaxID=651086 RepID=UPI000E2FD25A|nr:hypothetical protein [Parahaliea mediterranea]